MRNWRTATGKGFLIVGLTIAIFAVAMTLLLDALIGVTRAQLAVTSVLVGVTAYYAYQTYAIVQEMRRARGVQVMPVLVATIELLGAGDGLMRLENVGPGPALDVDVEFLLEPAGPTRRWTTPALGPGSGHSFFPDGGEDDPSSWLSLDKLTGSYETLRIRGSCKDALGVDLPVDDSVDLREFWELTKAAKRVRPHERERETVKALEGMEKHLKTIAETMKKPEMQRALQQMLEPEEEGED